jgi:dihydrofolate reductase
MRKIIVGEFISLDGVVEAPEKWHFPYANEEMFGVMGALSAQTDTMLLGRITYDSFAEAFANAPADDPAGAMMNRPAKVVASRTRTELDWAGSSVLDGDLLEAIAKLKTEPGADILTTGSISLVQAMLRAGLVDELNLLVHPIVLGSGRRLFQDGVRVPLDLVSCEVFSTGVTHQVYRVA